MFVEDRTIFQGLIYDDLGVLSNAHIVNLQTKKATSSLNQGEFEIFAKVGDSLKITSVGYKTKILKLKTQHFGIQTTKIHLKKDIIELDEVVVGNNNLLGILESDVKGIKEQPQIDAKLLRLPNAGVRKLTSAERKLYTATTSGGGISVDYIINTLSGRLKKLKKLKEFEDAEKEIKWLKIILNITLLMI